jgi:pimeloyl-ACP methyl ester carboxylesterase
MPYLEAQDCSLFYTVDDHTDPWTRPDTVLLVHGFTECTEAWRAWVPHFSSRLRARDPADRRLPRGGRGSRRHRPRDARLHRPPIGSAMTAERRDRIMRRRA